MIGRSKWMVLALCVGLLAGCGDDPTVDGEFTDKEEQTETTTVSGQALTEDGEPAADVTVYASAEGEPTRMTLTDAQGRFVLEDAPAGDVTLVLNNGNGFGALLEMTVFGSGDNEAGSVQLRSLESISGIVDMQGVGFEERVSTGAGNYEFPVYSSDASKVYAARKLDGQSRWSVVEVDTATGQERVLLEDQPLRDIERNRLGESDWPVFELLEDRYLVFVRRDEAFNVVVYDVHFEKVVFDSADVGAEWGAAPRIAGGKALITLANDGREIQDAIAYPYVHKYRAYIFDAASATTQEGPLLEDDWSHGPWSVHFNGDVAAYKMHSACRDEQGQLASCLMVNPENLVHSFNAFRTDDLDEQVLWSGDAESAQMELPGSGHSVYLTRDDTTMAPSGGGSVSVTRHDLAAGTSESRLAYAPCSPCTAQYTDFDPDADKLLIAWGARIEAGVAYVDGLTVFDFAADSSQQVDPSVQVDGTNVEMCDASPCKADFSADGLVRVRETFERSSGDWWGASVDYDGATAVDTRFFDLWESDGQVSDFDPTLHVAPGGDVEAMRIRRGDTGFYQYSLRQDGSTEFVQRTFLTAQHHHAAFSADGETLFYFTRDPISGYEQLFKLSVDSLPTIQ